MSAYINGIDVSRWQPTNLDWEKISQKFKFVFIKVTQGSAYSIKHILKCRQFALNASEAGLKVGYYHYAEPDSGSMDAAGEAQYFMRMLSEHSFPETRFPYVLDMEEPVTLDKDQIANWIYEFQYNVKGQSIILYSGTPWLTDHTPEDSHLLKDLPLWLAQYPKTFDIQKPPKLPKLWTDFTIWQYSNAESVPCTDGTKVDVDVNIMHPDFWRKYIPE